MSGNPNFPINTGDTSQSNPATGDFILQGVAPAAALAAVRVGKIVLPNGAQVEYLAIADGDTDTWEIGKGVYENGTFHLVRTVVNSSNSDALVNFTGVVNLYFTSWAQGDPLGALPVNVNQPIPTLITDLATNGTNTVYIGQSSKVYVTTVAGGNVDWVAHENVPAAFISICRFSGIGYVAVANAASGAAQVWVNAAEDGLSWVNQNVFLPFIPACIRTDGTTLVICGSNAVYPIGATTAGQIWTSTDAVTWTQRTSNAGANNLTWLSYNPTSTIWWCVGAAGKLLSSPDATTWTSRTSNTAVALVRVEQTPDGTTGAIAISGDGSLIYTTAPGTVGTAWTKVDKVAGGTGSTNAWTGLAMDNAVYVITSSANTGIYSTNFTTWAKWGGGSMNGVCFGNANYFAVGASGVLAGSALNALAPYSDAQLDASWNCCVYDATNSIFLAAGNGGLLTTFNHTTFAATSRTSGFGASNILAGLRDEVGLVDIFVGAGGKIFWSVNGINTYTAPTGTPSANQLNAINEDASNTLNKFCICGESGTIVTLTAAGAAQTVQTSGTTASLKGVAGNNAGTWVIVGASVILHSTNAGVTWTIQDNMTNGIGTPSITIQSIVHDGTQFVIKSTTGLIFWSTAGTSWTYKGIDEGSLATTSTNLFYVNALYVGTGTTGLITSSSNCTAFAIQRTAFAWTGSGIGNFDGTNFRIFGTSGYYNSTDGLAWSSYLNGNATAATSLSGHLAGCLNFSGTIITSTDGATFSLIANQISAAANIAGMANDGTNMILVTGNAVYRSSDNGTTWTQTASRPVFATFAGVPACTYGNGYFIVTGTLGYWIYSSDGGATWTAGTRVSHSFQSICYDATLNLFIGLCTNGVIVTGTGTTLTANNGLVTAGSPIGASARIATDGLGNVIIADIISTTIATVYYYTNDGSTFKMIAGGMNFGNSSVGFVCMNGVFFGLANTNAIAYTSDRSTWFYRQFSYASPTTQWAIYFGGYYLFFTSGNIARLG